MIKQDMLKRLLKSAAEEKAEVLEQPAPRPETSAPPVTQKAEVLEKPVTQKAVYQKRFYVYNAPYEGSIPFSKLQTLLGKQELRKEIADKLRGGTSEYQANYFSWRKMYFVTDNYDPNRKNTVVYEIALNPNGSKQGVAMVYPKNAPVTAETIEKDFLLFSTVHSERDVINFDTGVENYFVDISSGTIENAQNSLLMKGILPNSQEMSSFKGLFDQYRLWIGVGNGGRLVNPDFTLPEKSKMRDGVPGGVYLGGEDSFAYLMKVTGNMDLYHPKQVVPGPKEDEKKPEPKQQQGQPQEQKQPVDENAPEYKPAGPTKAVKGDIISPSERFSNMSDNSKIRGMTHRTVLNFLKKAEYQQTQTSTSGSSSNKSEYSSRDIQEKKKLNLEENRALDELERVKRQEEQLRTTNS